MLYREIIAVCSQIHTKHINTLCGQNVELFNVKLAVHMLHYPPTVTSNPSLCLSVSPSPLQSSRQSVSQTTISAAQIFFSNRPQIPARTSHC